jgi:hypothetical protein
MPLAGKKSVFTAEITVVKKITWPEKCAERHSFQYPLEGYKEAVTKLKNGHVIS